MVGMDISEKLRTQLAGARTDGEVTIPEGTFLLTGDFSIPAGTRLTGSGSQRTMLRSSGGTVLRIDNVSNVTVKGFSLSSGDGYCSVSVRPGAPKAKESACPVNNVKLLDIAIENTVALSNRKKGKHGIEVKAWANENISNVLIQGCWVTGSTGAESFKGLDNCYVASYDAAGTGQVSDVRIENCEFARAGQQNLSIAGKGLSKPTRITILNCKFSDSALAGVDLEEASDVTIVGCSFRGDGLNTEYFTHEKPESSMRSGLTVYRTDVAVSNCTFENCFYGYSSVNTQRDGVRFTFCTFDNAPLDRGSFASMANTSYQDCQFAGDRPLVNFYNSSCNLSNCSFMGRNSSILMLAFGGGGIASRSAGRGEFVDCSFVGTGGVLMEANYETLQFTECTFRGLSELITTGGEKRINMFLFQACGFTDVGTLGDFAAGSIESLTVNNSEGTLYRSLMRSSLRNGDFRFEGNIFTLPADGSSLLDKYKSFVFVNNTLHPAAAPGKTNAGKTGGEFLRLPGRKSAAREVQTTLVKDNMATGKGNKISNEKK